MVVHGTEGGNEISTEICAKRNAASGKNDQREVYLRIMKHDSIHNKQCHGTGSYLYTSLYDILFEPRQLTQDEKRCSALYCFVSTGLGRKLSSRLAVYN